MEIIFNFHGYQLLLTAMIRSFIIISIIIIPLISSKEIFHGPGGLEEHESTTCDQFSQNARFNPYSVLDSEWVVFYYWGPVQSTIFYWFYVPGQKRVEYFKELLEGHVKEAINWTAKYVVMKERNNMTSLLIERSDRGEYDLYTLFRGLQKGYIIEPIDVRLKQTGDNRYIGLMVCKENMVYVMSRVRDVPPKKKIQDAAARIGYRGRGGKSYLYQGHQWMPIPEADERIYWKPSRVTPWMYN